MKKLPYLFLFCNFLFFTNISIQNLSAQDISSGLVGHWRFDGDLKDATSRGNHATSNNTPVYVADVTGGANNALALDGTDQFLTIPDLSDYGFGTHDFTFSTWVNYNSIGISMSLIDKTATDLGLCLLLDKNGDGQITALTRAGNEVSSQGRKINDGIWHLIVFSRETGISNGTSISILSLYVDGQLNNSVEFTAVDDVSTSTPIYIAQNPTNTTQSRYRGSLDDYRAYNRSLTSNDISTLYKARGVLNVTEYTYYKDRDNDGFGDSNATIVTQSSTPPAGYVANNRDCNDKNAAINPNAVEICGNGIDENCDGIAETSLTGITGTSTSTLPTCLDEKGSITTVFKGLDPKTYKVILQDAVTGCVYYSADVKLDPAAALTTPTVTVTQPSCTLGSGTITFTNPTSGALYSFDAGVTFIADASKSGLAPGVYRLCYRNIASGCISKEIEVTINAVPAGLSTPTVSVTQPTCEVGQGTIKVTSPTSGVTYSFDNGSSYQTSNTKSNLGAGTYTVRVRNDAGCISNGVSTTINNSISALVAPTLNVTQPTCTNPFGTITVTTNLTNISYSYDRGVTFISSSSKSGLEPSTYYICIKDNTSGCISKEAQATINVAPVGPSTPSVATTQPTCNNALGAIRVTSPLSNVVFSFDNGSSFQDFNEKSGLGVGVYSVRVKDFNSGCVSGSTSATLSAAVGSSFTPVVNVSHPTCFVSTGTITFTSPTSGVTYSYDGGITFITASSKSGLASGTYQVCVKDNLTGCISREVEVIINAVPNGVSMPSVTVTQPTCTNGSGTITINSSVSGVVYSIDNGASFQTSNVRSGLAPGTYQIRLRNSANCISPSVAVTLNPATGSSIVPTGTITEPTCTVPTGTINFTYPLGSNYTYSYDGGVTFVPESSRSGLAPGIYRLCVRDINTGCISVEATATVTPAPAGLSAPTVSVVQPNCYNNAGSITITSTNSSLSYSINNGTSYQSSNVFNNLSAGTYSVRVRNSSCISAATVVILVTTNGSNYVPTCNVNHPTCSVPTGTVTFTYPMGPNYHYSFDGGVTFVPEFSRSGMAPGNHRICVRDIYTGCISNEIPVVINYPPSVLNAPTVNVVQPTCSYNYGSITITNPTSGVQYSINNGVSYQSSNVFNNLAPGTYQVRVKDNYYPCVSPATVVTLNAATGSGYQPTCNVNHPTCAVPTGTITFTYPMGSNFHYSFDGGVTFVPEFSRSNMSPGNHNICARDIYTGCITRETVAIINYPPSVLNPPTVNVIQPTCSYNYGSITITNPTSGVQYSINNGISYQSSNVFNNLAPGTYQVRVKDNYYPCVSPATIVTLNAATGSGYQPTCNILHPTCTLPTGTITFTYPMGPNYHYSFDGGATFGPAYSRGGMGPGNHRICVRDIYTGCISNEIPVVINYPPGGLNAPLVSVTQPNCINAWGSITVTNPSSGVLYSVDNGNTYQSSNVFNNLPAGNYYVKVKDTYCVSAATLVTLTVSMVTFTPTVTTIQPNCTTPTGTITFTYPLGANYEYSYNGGATFINAISQSGLVPGSYRVCARVKGTNCISDELTVIISPVSSSLPAPLITIVQPTCNNLQGSITVTNPSTGVTYSFDGGITYQSSPTKSLPAGTYSVVVKNGAGCISVATLVQLNAAISGDYLPIAYATQPTCAVPTGTITFTTPTSGYSYSYDRGISFGPQSSKSGLLPGTYGVCVLNLSTGCISKELEFTINAAPTLLAAPAVTTVQPNCTTATGTITVTTANPGGTFSFNNGVSFQSSATSPALASGNYSVIIKNSAGCVSLPTLVTINVAPVLGSYSINASSTSVCSGDPVTLSVSPACATCTYQWSPGGATSSSITVNPVGTSTYTVSITNSGCQTTATKTITTTTPVAGATVAVLQPNCTTFGKITIMNVPPGASTRIVSSTYAPDNAAGWVQDKNVYTNLIAGLYEVKIKLGCSESTVKVALYPELFRFTVGKCYKIVNFSSNKALNVTAMSMSSGASITQVSYTGMAGQNWYFTDFNGYEKISARHSGLALMNTGSITQSTYAAGPGDWFIECIGGGRYRIQNKASGQYLSISGNSQAEGANVVTTSDNGSDPSVHWYIIETPCGTGADLIRENPSSTEGVKALNSLDGSVKNLRNAPTSLDESVLSTEMSTKNTTKVQNARIFPNPANHYIEVQLDKIPEEGFSVSILNALGSQVAEMKTIEGQTLRLNTQSLPNGLYIIQIAEKGKAIIRKEIVIQK